MGGGRRSSRSLSCCLSAADVGFLVIHCPWGIGPPLQSGYRPTVPNPNGIVRFHTYELRPGGCLLYPGDGRAYTTGPFSPVATCRNYNSNVPAVLYCFHHPRLQMTRHRHLVAFTRPVSPSLWRPDGAGTLGPSPELRRSPSPATQYREGRPLSACRELRSRDHLLISFLRVHSQRVPRVAPRVCDYVLPLHSQAPVTTARTRRDCT